MSRRLLHARGGVSAGIYASELRAGVRDDPSAVREEPCARRSASAYPGVRLRCSTRRSRRAPLPAGASAHGDALVTTVRGGAQRAHHRLRPVLLAEPHARVSSPIHAGWRGALAGVVGPPSRPCRARRGLLPHPCCGRPASARAPTRSDGVRSRLPRAGSRQLPFFSRGKEQGARTSIWAATCAFASTVRAWPGWANCRIALMLKLTNSLAIAARAPARKPTTAAKYLPSS